MFLRRAAMVIRPLCDIAARRRTFAFCAALSISLAGCGSSATGDRLPVFPATGRLVFDGRPVTGAYIVLHPKTAGEGRSIPRPHAVAAADGSFTLTSYESNDGAPAGDYAVTVELRKLAQHGGDIAAGPNTLPSRYEKPDTTPVFVHIADESNELGPIKIVK